jgi:hypothetical protein
MRRTGIVSSLLVLLACGHSEPFLPLDHSTDEPFQPGPPDRLTANTGSDEEITFTPDGRELMYVLNRSCLGFIPAHQARAREWRCAPPEPGIADRYRFPALSSAGRLAFMVSRQREFEVGPFYQAVLVAPLSDLRDSAEVTPVPFRSVVDDVLHREISRLVWVRGDSLVIVADSIVYLTDPRNRSQPRVYERLALPGPAYSVQPGRGGRVLYLRVRGESRVIEFDLATRTVGTFYDFGSTPAGVVAVGPRSMVTTIPGAVLRLNLGTGAIDTFPAAGLQIRELAMTPNGSDIIAAALQPPPPPQQGTTDLYRLRQ